MDGQWLQFIAGKAWIGLIAVAGWLYRLGTRVSKLEGLSDERTRQLTEIKSEVSKLGDKLDDKFNTIISHLIERVPKP